MEEENQAYNATEDSAEPHKLQIAFKNIEDVEEVICEDYKIQDGCITLHHPNCMCMWNEKNLKRRIIPLSKIEDIHVLH